MLNEEWGMQNAEWGMGNGEWASGICRLWAASTQSIIADLIRKSKIRRSQSPNDKVSLPIVNY